MKITQSAPFRFSALTLGILASLGVAEALVPAGGRARRAPEGTESVPGEYIVKLRAHRSRSAFSQIRTLEMAGLPVEEALVPEDGVFLIKSTALDSDLRVQGFDRSEDIEFIEPNYVYRIEAGAKPPARPQPSPSPAPPPSGDPNGVKPNDPDFASLWGLHNLGQKTPGAPSAGFTDADIDAPLAWKISTGSGEVIVGVVDTGIDTTHPDLRANLWSKTGADGKTIFGFDAIDNDFVPQDANGHGTHVAGTIGAHGHNGTGVVGVNWKVKLMGLRFLGKDGSGTTAGAIRAIDWGVQNGARVLNNSWGGGPFSEALRDSIVRAQEKGVLFVAAAGNASSDNDRKPSYPASYDLDNIVTVAASTNRDGVANFSNYGRNSVHLAAPGADIYSTYVGGKYKTLSGTSMASPHVAGAAALALAVNPELTVKQLKTALLSSADRVNAFATKTSSGGRLNVNRLLEEVK